MKVTHSLVLVALALLDMDREDDSRVWGYALSKRSGVRSGVLYPQLDRMMGEGWLEDHWEEHAEGKKRPPRRYYKLTDQGRRDLGAVVARAESQPRFQSMKEAFA
ncbi:helix-turn-helix transcriptional regulator [Pengzhenrongella sicca]|uniref:Helix-turn-helix transcriptional regulator n=1 Tax=Pengzhenrongella sicca TaxID=2819238 RepID=A0A8A4ZDS8_9MICO|nr:helix-turn-helix transcriptional regulator [Pengzhenrongella sicca]QTE30064.1 helix-turn-helix transcriptional regulator [Pengzhenrongella sicca]